MRKMLAILLIGLTCGGVARGARGATPAPMPPPPPQGTEIGFVEDFALGADREAALKLLIPGTEDHYFYSALNALNQGKFDEVQKILDPWIKRYGRTAGVTEIENRRALMLYDTDPKASLEFLRQRLGLNFPHQQEALDPKSNLPTALDAALLDRKRLIDRALKDHPQTLDGFEPRALDWVLTSIAGNEPLVTLTPESRRNLLRGLTRPDYPGLAKLVMDDLAAPGSGPFGSLAIHRALLLEQLDECLKSIPKLREEAPFIQTYLSKLQPSPDSDWRHDAKEREAYLDRLWAFVADLVPAQNSLKANVLYQRLVHDRALGIYDKNRFMTYIKLPRSMPYVEPKFLEKTAPTVPQANLSQDFSAFTLMSPIRNDEALVRDYLLHFFVEEDSYEPYQEFVRDTYLKPLFAEAKIVGGIGDPEKWYSQMEPAAYQALKDRVDLDFLPANKTLFAPDDAVGLDIAVKNVKSLIVRIYEINAANFYRENASEINTDINLDGLAATSEKAAGPYEDAPLRRVVRHFDFPELKGRGVYVLEFIGNGKSSRALVHKGRLRFLQRPSAAGHVFTVLDEAGRLVPKATVWTDGHAYAPDKEGRISVPYSTSPAHRPVVLMQDDFASLDTFDHAAETYQLTAGFYVDRETLLKRKKATVLVRPVLTVNGAQAPLSLIEEATLLITSVDSDGVPSAQAIQNFALPEDREAVQEFQVPENLQQIQFVLRGKVKNLSQNKKVDVAASAQFAVNLIDKSEKNTVLHLVHVADDQQPGGVYALDLLGKTGEPRTGRPVQIVLKHRDFRDAIDTVLQTDDAGRVRLGALADIESVRATDPNGTDRDWRLPVARHTYPVTIDGPADQGVRLPYEGADIDPQNAAAMRAAFSLLEQRGGAFRRNRGDAAKAEGFTFTRDRVDAVKAAGGFVTVSGLEPGDYLLLFKESGVFVQVRITAPVAGAATAAETGYLLGDGRSLEVRNSAPLQIVAIEPTSATVRVRLANAGPLARVHVVATRVVPAFPIYGALAATPLAEPVALSVPKADSVYLSGRNIGDEYRYILERRAGKRFPGNMLERPGLLLNPWAVRDTVQAREALQEGEQWGEAAKAEATAATGGEGKGGAGPKRPEDFANLDFLPEQSVVLPNLQPDKDGVVTVPRNLLAGCRQLHVVAVDAQNVAYREAALPETQAVYRDLRLAAALDPAKHFTEQRRATAVAKGEKFTVASVGTAQFEVYDTLASVHRLFVAIGNDPTLREFEFVTRWSALKDDEKREKYAKYVCHELNFFLYRKDPDFFKAVVAPYLVSKKDKTFLDTYLLAQSGNASAREALALYNKPWAFEHCNTFEQILLGGALPDEKERVARHTHDVWELLPPDTERANRLFDTALMGSALSLMRGGNAGAAALGEGESPLLWAYGGEDENLTDMAGKRVANTTGLVLGGQLADKDRQLAKVTTTTGADIPVAAAASPVGRVDSVAAARRTSLQSNLGVTAGAVVRFEGGDTASSRITNGPTLALAATPAPLPANGTAGEPRIQVNNGPTAEFELGNKAAEMETKFVPVNEERSHTAYERLAEKQTATDQFKEAAKKSVSERRAGAYYSFADSDLARRKDVERLYLQVEQTKEWAENNYYHLPIAEQSADLVTVGRFWTDYADYVAAGAQGPFLSTHLAEASRNFTEAMTALALLDLPFEAGKHEKTTDDAGVTIVAASPLVVFHKEVREAAPEAEKTPILVSQNFYRQSDRYRIENGEQVDKFVTEEFLAGVVYGCQVAVTNPTSSRQKLDVLLQVPQGALPALGSRYTRDVHIDLAPFNTTTLEYYFYFPAPGDQPHYPVHVARDEKLMASAAPFTFHVVEKATILDKLSWDYISQHGSEDDVLGFLRTENLDRVKVERMAWRMQDAAFFGKAIPLLEQRHVYDGTLWSYALKHNVLAPLREFFRHQDEFLSHCGAFIDCELLRLDPVERHAYQHLEYGPLANARAHQLGRDRRILNDSLAKQYLALLNALRYRPALDTEDRLDVTYYLLLQDRIEDAQKFFAQVKRDAVTEAVQYDYLAVYLAFYSDKPGAARPIAERYAKYPVDSWRKRFAAVLAQLDEAEGKGAAKVANEESNAETQARLAAAAPTIDFTVEARKVHLKYQNLTECRVNYYEMDVELLFSRNPFVTEFPGRFASVRPNETATVKLPAGAKELEIDIPKRFANSNVLVEVTAGEIVKSRAYYANILALQLTENYGQVRVAEEKTDKPLPRAYVKVYARMKDGKVRFYKDGYTDLRGRFDYATVSGEAVDAIEKFSILVLSDANGAVVREVAPPKR